VRAHIFLCMLAYYVEWHMREAWRPLLFADEDQAAKQTRDPVAPAKRSAAALRKVHTKVLDDGTPVHSFPTLLKELSRIVRNVCRPRGAGPEAPTFEIVTTPTPTQQRAFDLAQDSHDVDRNAQAECDLSPRINMEISLAGSGNFSLTGEHDSAQLFC